MENGTEERKIRVDKEMENKMKDGREKDDEEGRNEEEG